MTAGFTGLNSAQARKAGFTFFTSLTRDNSHAHYYPGAKPVLIKVIAEEGKGRTERELSAQGEPFGSGGSEGFGVELELVGAAASEPVDGHELLLPGIAGIGRSGGQREVGKAHRRALLRGCERRSELGGDTGPCRAGKSGQQGQGEEAPGAVHQNKV